MLNSVVERTPPCGTAVLNWRYEDVIYSVHLSVPSICFVYVFVCRKLSPH